MNDHNQAIRPPESETGADAAGMRLEEENARVLRLHLAAEERFRILVENASDIIFQVRLRPHEAWEYEYVSPAATSVIGYTSEDFLRSPSLGREIVHPADLHRLSEAYGSPVVGLGVFVRWRHRDGRWRSMSINCGSLRSADGELTGLVGVARDITGVMEARAANDRLVNSASQVAEAIVITSVNGRIEYVNRAFTSLTGYSAAEAVGTASSLLKSGVHPPEFYRKMWAELLSGQTWRGILTNRRKDGSLYQEEATISPIRSLSNQITGFVAVKRDVSEENRIREELLLSMEFEFFGRLVAGVAHEVRNPLHAIQALVSSIEIDMMPGDENVLLLAAIQNQVDRLSKLLCELLEISRPSTTLNIDDWFAADLCLTAVRMVREGNSKMTRSFRVVADVALRIAVDRDRFLQVLLNLIDNAVHHTAQSGSIRIEAVGCDGHVDIRIIDDGSGIPESILSNVVKPFFTTRKGGTGLGLSLVKHVVESHGGSFDIRNNAPRAQGCTAEIRLPADRVIVR